MTPEQIEKKAQELYPEPTEKAYQDLAELAYEKTECYLLRNSYTAGALSRQPEIDQLQEENRKLSERSVDIMFENGELQGRVKELEDGLNGIERLCDNQNQSHDGIWRITHELLTKTQQPLPPPPTK